MPKTAIDIDNLIEEIKKKTGLSQEEIAVKIGYNRSYISQAKKTDSEKLHSALYNGFKDVLENITKGSLSTHMQGSSSMKTKIEGVGQEQKDVSSLIEANLLHAKNYDRLISILEERLTLIMKIFRQDSGIELDSPGTTGTETKLPQKGNQKSKNVL